MFSRTAGRIVRSTVTTRPLARLNLVPARAMSSPAVDGAEGAGGPHLQTDPTPSGFRLNTLPVYAFDGYYEGYSRRLEEDYDKIKIVFAVVVGLLAVKTLSLHFKTPTYGGNLGIKPTKKSGNHHNDHDDEE